MEVDEEGTVVIANVYGDFCVRKTRRKRQKKLVQEMLHDYASNTTLHGLSYTTKRGLTIIEKIFWLITFIASLCLCCYLTHNVWVKWRTSPVIVTVSEQLVSVRKVPFPSVTICPQLKCKATKYNFTAAVYKLQDLCNKSLTMDYEFTEDDKNDFIQFKDISNVCSSAVWTFEEFYYYFRRNYSDANVTETILDVAPTYEDLFYLCKLEEQYIDCSDLLSTVLTSEGLCYTVNSLSADEILRLENVHKNYTYLSASTPSKNWTVDHGYSHYGSDAYPRAGRENGAEPDLQIMMIDYITEHDDVCNVLNSGFKVYVQHPSDYPQSSLYYYAVLNTQVSSMALSFSILNTSEALQEYPAQTRQCYFPHERYLKYFKIYTANNCRLECLSNYTFEHCDCVEYYMPRETSNQICTVERTSCIQEARENLTERIHNREDDDCVCLPACNSVDYEAEILKTDFNMKKLFKSASKIYSFPSNVNGTKFSKLEMYFKRPRFVSMRRSELFGVTDFLANIGGLLGLFLGFSFLSLVELLYFLTLRLGCVLKNDIEEEKLQRTKTIAMSKKN